MVGSNKFMSRSKPDHLQGDQNCSYKADTGSSYGCVLLRLSNETMHNINTG